MPNRSIYLAKYRGTTNQRAHFAIFIPDIASDRTGVRKDFKTMSTEGTIIHVVGEPVMVGFALEIKRHYECKDDKDLENLVRLGHIDEANLYDSPSSELVKDVPRGVIEREAGMVPLPPKGQNIRAPIDGVTTKRCQEWTMEYLDRLVQRGYLKPSAVEVAQNERDPPNFGIFGAGKATES
ncbi:hypothetical protein F5Y10DRAFT_270793 [Nemania abortiva]|nr:hypothetical protein F5Y10DRAFT_270793 [Nemania abortiva]